MAALQAMGFKVEECGVALDATDCSSTHACVEHTCELLVEAAEHKAELAARCCGGATPAIATAPNRLRSRAGA